MSLKGSGESRIRPHLHTIVQSLSKQKHDWKETTHVLVGSTLSQPKFPFDLLHIVWCSQIRAAGVLDYGRPTGATANQLNY